MFFECAIAVNEDNPVPFTRRQRWLGLDLDATCGSHDPAQGRWARWRIEVGNNLQLALRRIHHVVLENDLVIRLVDVGRDQIEVKREHSNGEAEERNRE